MVVALLFPAFFSFFEKKEKSEVRRTEKMRRLKRSMYLSLSLVASGRSATHLGFRERRAKGSRASVRGNYKFSFFFVSLHSTRKKKV